MQLSNIGEFGLIDIIRNKFESLPRYDCEGIGDDCALLPAGGDEVLVVTTDLLVEGVHFLRRGISPRDLGYKSLAVNLSDVASMGVAPFASFLSLALPRDIEAEWMDAFLEGYHELSERFGVALLGGDTTSAAPGALTISVTAVGRGKRHCVKRRSMANIGDKLFVTGLLGGSSKGLHDILEEKVSSSFIPLHNRPKPYVDEGVWLGDKESVHAMMDVSDGVASDLKHILQASNVSAKVLLDKIPTNTTIEQALCGGEDYVLLFTADPDQGSQLQEEYHQHFGETLYEIGEIIAGDTTIEWWQAGKQVYPSWKGFTHF